MRFLGAARIVAIGALMAQIGFARDVLAQPANGALAESLFEDGKALMAKKDFARACPKLEESLRIEATGPTLFVLADCLEQAGKTASAWARWREARDYAHGKGKSDKEQEATRRASAIEAKVPKIRLEVAPAVASAKGLEVKLDGAVVSPAVFQSDLPHDPGEVVVEVAAPGKRPLKVSKVAAAGPTVVISITALEALPETKTDPAASTAPSAAPATAPGAVDKSSPPDASRGSTQRTAGLIVGGVGLAGVAVGGIFLALAGSTNSKINAADGRGECFNNGCADQITKRDNQSTIGIAGLAGGGAFLVGGAVLYLTAPSAGSSASAPRLRYTAEPRNGLRGVVFEGSW
jgi:hypothetical protein